MTTSPARRVSTPQASLFWLALAAVLCAAHAASAAVPTSDAAAPAEAAESPAPIAPAAEAAPAPAQPKTAAEAAANAAAAAAPTPAAAPAAPAARPLVRDAEPVTAPPGPPAPGASRPFSRRTRRLVEQPEAPRGEARQGLLLSFGLGGASQFASAPGLGRTASTDADLRIGYGFSDRLQMFLDFNGQSARYGYGQHTSMDTVTLRAQTVLIGDRQGNGLTLNGGVGLGSFNPDTGGFGSDYCCPPGGRGRYYNDRPLGFVAAGGLSYDARLGRYLSLSPEIFATWMAVPNDDRKQDIATQVGLRLRLLWYLK